MDYSKYGIVAIMDFRENPNKTNLIVTFRLFIRDLSISLTK